MLSQSHILLLLEVPIISTVYLATCGNIAINHYRGIHNCQKKEKKALPILKWSGQEAGVVKVELITAVSGGIYSYALATKFNWYKNYVHIIEIM